MSASIINPQGPMPRGIDNFAEAITHGRCFVDKSLLIQEIFRCNDKVILITRPRRFGKTINLSMLKHFFEKPIEGENTRQLFDGMLISQQPEIMQHQGKHPVIYMTFKDVKENDWESALAKMQDMVTDEIERHPESEDLSVLQTSEAERFRQIMQREASTVRWHQSLFLLSKLLTLHHKQSPWLLLDEYDTPIHAAYMQSKQDRENIHDKNSYYSEMITFMRGLLGVALKGNDTFLHKAVITGILRVAKEDIFSDLNNLGVYGVMDWKFDRHFGFTESEVQQLFTQRQLQSDLPCAQQWYNGYQFGRQTVYNPWSIVSYVSNLPQPAQSYWVNTGSTGLIRHLMSSKNPTDVNAIESLLLGHSIEQDVADNLALRELESLGEALWSIALTSGYVTAVQTRQGVLGHKAVLRIPNQEVRIAFQRLARSWLNKVPNNTSR